MCGFIKYHSRGEFLDGDKNHSALALALERCLIILEWMIEIKPRLFPEVRDTNSLGKKILFANI